MAYPSIEPENMTMLREALPALLRDGLSVPERAVAVGAMFRHRLDGGYAQAPQFVAYLPDGHIVDAPLTREAATDARSWAEALIMIAADVDPQAAAGAAHARLAVYAPRAGGTDWVDIWFGDCPTPWQLPGAEPHLSQLAS